MIFIKILQNNYVIFDKRSWKNVDFCWKIARNAVFVKISQEKLRFHHNIERKYIFRQKITRNARFSSKDCRIKIHFSSKDHEKNAIFVERWRKKCYLSTDCKKKPKCFFRQNISRKTWLSIRHCKKNAHSVKISREKRGF